MAELLTPYPPRTPLLEPVGNVPWSRWFTDLRTAINGLLADVTALQTDPVAMARLPVAVRTQALTMEIASFTSPGSGIATGIAGFLVVPWAGTLTEALLLSSDPLVTAGSIVVDLWRAPYASFPPTAAQSICGSAKPTLSGAIESRDRTLTGWTTALDADDILGIQVDSVATLKRVRLSLTVVLT